MDSATQSGYDVRFVHLQFVVCDLKLLPKTHLVPYRDPTGTITKFEIDIEVEIDQSEPLNAWAIRKRGRPYPNGTEFGESERRDAEGNPLQRGAQPRHPSPTSTTTGGWQHPHGPCSESHYFG